MTEPWGEGTPWKNSVAFYTWLRGSLRRIWSKHPVKLELLKAKRFKIPCPSGKRREIFACACSICTGVFPMKECQVDHRTPAGSLRCPEDVAGFVQRLLCVSTEDLRVVCKYCNSALAYAEKQGISFEEAKATKVAIELCKTKQDVKWLSERGLIPEKSAPKRRTQIIEVLKEEL